jgi:hypothetical protein
MEKVRVFQNLLSNLLFAEDRDVKSRVHEISIKWRVWHWECMSVCGFRNRLSIPNVHTYMLTSAVNHFGKRERDVFGLFGLYTLV